MADTTRDEAPAALVGHAPPAGADDGVGPTVSGVPLGVLRVALRVIRIGPVSDPRHPRGGDDAASPVFLTTGNVGNVLAQSAAIAVLAVGQLLVILTRGIDLSVGSTLALASVSGRWLSSTAPRRRR